jgi:hypothetical protein
MQFGNLNNAQHLYRLATAIHFLATATAYRFSTWQRQRKIKNSLHLKPSIL